MCNPWRRHYFFGRGPGIRGDFRFLDSNDANALKHIILPNTKNVAEGYTPGKRSRVMPLYSGTSNWKAEKNLVTGWQANVTFRDARGFGPVSKECWRCDCYTALISRMIPQRSIILSHLPTKIEDIVVNICRVMMGSEHFWTMLTYQEL